LGNITWNSICARSVYNISERLLELRNNELAPCVLSIGV
jgi:hypothetical protein